MLWWFIQSEGTSRSVFVICILLHWFFHAWWLTAVWKSVQERFRLDKDGLLSRLSKTFWNFARGVWMVVAVFGWCVVKMQFQTVYRIVSLSYLCICEIINPLLACWMRVAFVVRIMNEFSVGLYGSVLGFLEPCDLHLYFWEEREDKQSHFLDLAIHNSVPVFSQFLRLLNIPSFYRDFWRIFCRSLTALQMAAAAAKVQKCD